MFERQHERFTRRLETKFSSGDLSFTGISSNLSEGGLFIRTQRGFAPGTIIAIELALPDGKISFLKGRVKRSIRTSISTHQSKNGMGVELIEKDAAYINFIKSFATNLPEFQIISCPNCGVKNKVLSTKLSMKPKCGKCGTSLV